MSEGMQMSEGMRRFDVECSDEDDASDSDSNTSESDDDEMLSALMGRSMSAELLAQLQTLPSTGWIAPAPAGAQGGAGVYPPPQGVRGDSVGMRGRQRRQRPFEHSVDRPASNTTRAIGSLTQRMYPEACDCCGSRSHVAWRRMIDALLTFRLDDWHLGQLRDVNLEVEDVERKGSGKGEETGAEEDKGSEKAIGDE
jgi:hypothetical protein